MNSRGPVRFWLRPAMSEVTFWALLALLAGIVVTTGPLLTSDGPAHVSMAHFMLREGDPAWPMLNRVYELNPLHSPNALGHFMLAGLMRVVSPLAAEQVVQLLVLVTLPLAARLTLRRIAPDMGWLALFFFPVALQRMFFLGLYNFCFSVIGCMLCIWAYLRLRELRSPGRFVFLGAAFLVTLGFQASGWLAAVVAVATLAVAESWACWREGMRFRLALRLPLASAVCVLPSAVLFLAFLVQNAGVGAVEYGSSPLVRLLELFRGDALAAIGRTSAFVGLGFGGLLVMMLVYGLVRGNAVQSDGASDAGLRLALAWLPLGFVAILMIVPNRAGGAWTHMWRAEVFPFIGLAFACAAFPVHRIVRSVAIVVAVVGSLSSIGAVIRLQLDETPGALREFSEVDALIGPHCTIAPILGHFKLDVGNTARLVHHPMFHAASRMEWRADRPVLFSYVARLPVYPVRFRSGVDPQRLLYGWEPYQGDTRVRRFDIKAYEAATGMRVDYVLLWDVPLGLPGASDQDLRRALAEYRLIYRSSGGRMELYRRPGSDTCGAP